MAVGIHITLQAPRQPDDLLQATDKRCKQLRVWVLWTAAGSGGSCTHPPLTFTPSMSRRQVVIWSRVSSGLRFLFSRHSSVVSSVP